MTPELIITTPDGGNRAVRLEGLRYTLGRGSANELSLPEDAGLSRQHLLLEAQGAVWTVSDLGSKNGTHVNGVRLTGRHLLQPGDVITASYTRLVFGEILQPEQAPVQPAAPPRDRTLAFQQGVGVPGGSLAGARLAQLVASGSWRETPVTTMLRATRELAITRKPGHLFSLAFQLAGEAAHGAAGVLLTREGNELIVRARSGSGFQIPAGVRDEVLLRGTPIVQGGPRGFLAAPLQAGNQIKGMFYFEREEDQEGPLFNVDDLNLLTALGNVTAVCAEQLQAEEHEDAVRILKAELEQAAAIKQRVMPSAPPITPGFEVALHHTPCQTIAGDYFQFLNDHPGRFGVFLSDIAGRGLPMAVVLNSLHARVDVLAETVEDPGQFLTRINRMVPEIRSDNRLLTAFCCVADALSGMASYSNGGHLPALLIRESGQAESLRRGGMALGAMSRMQFETGQIFMQTGDIIAIYSDGLTETCNPAGQEFGEERLAAFLTECRNLSAQELERALANSLKEWSAGAEPEDDATLLILKRTEC